MPCLARWSLELRDAIDRVESDSTIRVVVLTGAGPAFCAGMDLKEASESTLVPRRRADHRHSEGVRRPAAAHSHASKPTIAAVNGDALAGGAGLMAACDLAIAADSARIGYPEVRRGLVAAIVMHDLSRQIGDRRARQLLLSGDLISSKVAHEWGLVNAVTSADRCVEEAIRDRQLAGGVRTRALASTKRLLDEATRPPARPDVARPRSAHRFGHPRKRSEGILAFVEKRPPRWASIRRHGTARRPSTRTSWSEGSRDMSPEQRAPQFPGFGIRRSGASWSARPSSIPITTPWSFLS